MLHLIIAKKVNPNASINFYIGNVAVDAISERDKKDTAHFRNAPDIENALREFALKTEYDYLKGILLHLYVDWKWDSTHMIDFANEIEGSWHPQYLEELGLMSAYAFHNTEWAYKLLEQMELWDGCGFVETEFITKENIYSYIHRIRKWHIENKLNASTAFSPELIEKFATDTADDFNKWFSDLTN